jgi:hypothetical protein
MSAVKFRPNRTHITARRDVPGPNQTRRQANDRSNGPWGDTLASKPNSVFRYCFANIYGLPIAVNHEKHDRITNTMNKHEIDVFGLAEVSLNFPQLSPDQQWIHRFPKLKTNSHYATNKHSTSQDRKLYGGTAYLTNTAASPKVADSGADPTGLGRWTWVKLTGRRGLAIRIIIDAESVFGYQPLPLAPIEQIGIPLTDLIIAIG